MDERERFAYMAGFLDGEGSIGANGPSGNRAVYRLTDAEIANRRQIADELRRLNQRGVALDAGY